MMVSSEENLVLDHILSRPATAGQLIHSVRATLDALSHLALAQMAGMKGSFDGQRESLGSALEAVDRLRAALNDALSAARQELNEIDAALPVDTQD